MQSINYAVFSTITKRKPEEVRSRGKPPVRKSKQYTIYRMCLSIKHFEIKYQGRNKCTQIVNKAETLTNLQNTN